MPVYVLTINGVTKTLREGTPNIQEVADGINTMSFEFVSLSGTDRPGNGDEVILTEDGVRIFGGEIDGPSESYIIAGHPGIVTKCQAVDFNEYIDRAVINLNPLPAGTLKDFLEAFDLSHYGVTLDPLQPDGPDLPELSLPFMSLRDAVRQVIDLSNGWLIEIDYNKVLRGYLNSAEAAPVSITTANRKAIGDVEVLSVDPVEANVVYVLGGTGQRTVTDAFTGDGSTTAFDLNYSLVSHVGYVTVNGTNETLDAPGMGATWSYTTTGGVTTITRTSAPTLGHAISITYTAQFPKLVTADTSPLPADRKERTYRYDDVFDVDVLQALANALVARTSVERKTVRYRTAEVGLHPGQVQTITVAERDLSGTFLITDVQIVQNEVAQRLERIVTAVSGTVYPGSLLEDVASWGGGSTGSSTAGLVTAITGGGVGGSGTSGTLAQWTSPGLIGNGPVASAILLSSGSYADPTWLTSLSAAKLTGTIANSVQDNITRLGTVSSGVWNAGAGIFGGHVTPSVSDTYDLGSPFKLWRQGYVSQMNAVLFAKETQSLYGGWLAVSKNAGVFAASVDAAETTIDFGTTMTSGQFVLVRAADNSSGAITAEYIQVGSLVSGTRYNVTRNLSGGGAKYWAEGTPFQVRGVSGDGWIELNAFDTPRMSIFTQGSAYNNSAESIRIGYLTGMPNSSSGIGAYMGDASNYLRWDGTTFKIVSGGLTIDNTGIRLGTPTAHLSSDAVKFERTAGLDYGGAGDVFGLYSLGVSTDQSLFLENSIVGGGTFSGRAEVWLRATGWDDAGAGASTAAASLRLRSDIAGASALFNCNLSSSGTIGAAGFGSHTFSAGGTGGLAIFIRNTTAGVGNFSAFYAGNDASSTAGQLFHTSSTYTTGTYDTQDALHLVGSRVGGISIAATHASGEVRFYAGGTGLVSKIDANGDYIPAADSTRHVGVPAKRFAYMTALAFNTSDMVMENGWALTESYRIGIAEAGIGLVDDRGALIAFFGRDRFYVKPRADVDALPYSVTTLAQRLQMDPTPQIRIKGYTAAGEPIFKTASDVLPMPDPLQGRTNAERRVNPNG